MLTPVKGTGKYQLEPGQNNMGYASELLYCSFPGNFEQNRPVCWSIIVNEKTMVGSPFFGFFSDRIQHRTKYGNVPFFIHSFRDEIIIDNAVAEKCSCKLYQRIWGTFCSYCLYIFFRTASASYVKFHQLRIEINKKVP
jgi:hypothetical protein